MNPRAHGGATRNCTGTGPTGAGCTDLGLRGDTATMIEELWWKITDHWKVIAVVALIAAAVAGLAARGDSSDHATGPAPTPPPATMISAEHLTKLRDNPEAHPRCAQVIGEYLEAAPDATGAELAALNTGVATTCGNHRNVFDLPDNTPASEPGS